MREAVFIVSPKMLNLGSFVPMRPLKVNVGEHACRVNVNDARKFSRGPMHPKGQYAPALFWQLLLAAYLVNKRIVFSHIPIHHHSYLSQGPV